ncbi:sugar kinase [Cohnella boryungensis]|uniref:Sugar kinase n=1 Tax=Cohnella boryungensis TaxID=768479 RepID=A0ABV8SB40_9BACL
MKKDLDVITIGDGMVTMNPRSKGPLRHVNEFERKVGGAELNLAIGCARLGLRTGWISRLGNDEFGKYVYHYARGEGIDVTQVELLESYATSVNFKEIREDGSGRTFYYRADSPTLTISEADIHADYIKRSRVLHITGVFSAIRKDDMSVIRRAIRLAKEHDVLVSFDPNIRLRLWSKEEARAALTALLPDVDILLTGEEEAALLLGTGDLDEMLAEFRKYGISRIAIKQGERGCTVASRQEVIRMPAVQVPQVVDTVGAGDGFNAGFLLGHLRDWPLERIAAFANKVGSMVVSVSGDNEGLPYYEEVEASEILER